MNKKQLNTLSASLGKALSPPSRKKIELSARIIDQIQPLPGIVSRSVGNEPKCRDSAGQLGKTEARHGSVFRQQAIVCGVPSFARVRPTSSHPDPSIDSSRSTDVPPK